MKVLELFAGTRSIGRAFERRGHEVFSVDWGEFENIDLRCDISTLTADDVLSRFGQPDVIWASPDCTSYSLAAISYHRERLADGTLAPKTDYAKFCDRCNAHVVDLIRELSPRLFFIENPVGGLCKMPFMRGIPRYLVTYCQYGDTRQKPTHIFTDCPDPGFRACKRGDKCHEAAPRGAKTGTQGIRGKKERAVIPPALCEYIVNLCEKHLQEGEKP